MLFAPPQALDRCNATQLDWVRLANHFVVCERCVDQYKKLNKRHGGGTTDLALWAERARPEFQLALPPPAPPPPAAAHKPKKGRGFLSRRLRGEADVQEEEEGGGEQCRWWREDPLLNYTRCVRACASPEPLLSRLARSCRWLATNRAAPTEVAASHSPRWLFYRRWNSRWYKEKWGERYPQAAPLGDDEAAFPAYVFSTFQSKQLIRPEAAVAFMHHRGEVLPKKRQVRAGRIMGAAAVQCMHSRSRRCFGGWVGGSAGGAPAGVQSCVLESAHAWALTGRCVCFSSVRWRSN